MKIAVVGGGFTGLTAAYRLTKQGHEVTLFEAKTVLGGLAYGFREKGWEWHLEHTYHHWFTNDDVILQLVDELGLKDKLIVTRPVTASLYDGLPCQLDSPLHLLRFPGLSLTDKLRTAVMLGYLKLTPFWKPLEQTTAEQLIKDVGGRHAFEVLWEPLLYGKFSTYAPGVSAAWFWARIKKRTPSLMYMQGGFHTLILALAHAISSQGGHIRFGKQLSSLPKGFDRYFLTTPTPLANLLVPDLVPFTKTLMTIPHLWAQTLILETKQPILRDVYWLNVTDTSYPFLAAVAHTNFMDKSHYGNHHLTYFGNYLPANHRYLSYSKEQLLKEFMPGIKKLTGTKPNVLNSFLFTGPFAQPVHERGYSRKIPPIKTPVRNIYLANMDYVVPWDRGTNYAAELGERAAYEITK